MEENKKTYENVLNILLKKKYPFIENVEVYRLKKLNDYNLDLDVNLYISRESMIEFVDPDCIDQIPSHESIFMSLFSFGLCSKGVIKRKEFEEYLITVFQASIDSSRILISNISVNVIAPSVEGEF